MNQTSDNRITMEKSRQQKKKNEEKVKTIKRNNNISFIMEKFSQPQYFVLV